MKAIKGLIISCLNIAELKANYKQLLLRRIRKLLIPLYKTEGVLL